MAADLQGVLVDGVNRVAHVERLQRACMLVPEEDFQVYATILRGIPASAALEHAKRKR